MPIEIVAKPTDWLPTDQERWAAFLETETGKRLLPFIAESAPQLLAKGSKTEILIRSGEVRGFQTVLRELILAAHPTAKDPQVNMTEYPPLEDDTKWNDGKSLAPETAPELTLENQPPPQE